MVAIIDYGMGNIHSVNKALQTFGAETLVTNNPEKIRAGHKVVLPGVGAFADAMQELERQGLIDPLLKHVQSRKPLLGICLGMQLLFESSEEAGSRKGLGILKGEVKRFSSKGKKVPHMGWNQLTKARSDCPLLKDIEDGAYVYFCHSYYPEPRDRNMVAATTDYGKDFCSLIWQESVYGAQFHPEKSQQVGLKMLKNFVELC